MDKPRGWCTDRQADAELLANRTFRTKLAREHPYFTVIAAQSGTGNSKRNRSSLPMGQTRTRLVWAAADTFPDPYRQIGGQYRSD